jgi:membrane protein
MINIKLIWKTTLDIVNKWSDDKAPKLGGSLAFFTISSLAPLVIIAIGIAGFIFGREAATGEIVNQIQGLIGREGALAVQSAIKSTGDKETSLIATIIGFVTLIIA